MGQNLRIDYDLLSNLSQQMYALRDKIDATSKVNHSFAPSDIGPDPKAAGAITDFYDAWKKAFQRAWDAMTTVGDDFNSVGNTFFDIDAQAATSMNQQNAQLRESDWESRKQAYDQYNQNKGKSQTVPVTDSKGNPVYDKNGKLETKQVPEWTQQQANQLNPSIPRQTDYTTFGQNGTDIHTHLIYKGDQLVGTESTVTPEDAKYGGTASQYLSYKETTMYGANGGYTTDMHYADGTEQKIVVVAQPDGSATKSIYDGTGKLTDQYTGNVKSDQWKQVGGDSSSGSSNSDSSNSQPKNDPSSDPDYYNSGHN
jgi:hypothetical protein